MKKAALTIGLFSLALVATSFTAPDTVNTISNEKLSINPPIGSGLGGSSAGGGRKQDNGIKNEVVLENNQSSFANINQSVGGNKKQD
ncbi:hypothetical protein AB9T88_03380 [Flavobacterium sp. LBUM151]